jgi:hypothetical protein
MIRIRHIEHEIAGEEQFQRCAHVRALPSLPSA